MATCVEEQKDAMSKISFSTNGLKMSVKSYIFMTIICFWSVISVATESVPRPRGVSLTSEYGRSAKENNAKKCTGIFCRKDLIDLNERL